MTLRERTIAWLRSGAPEDPDLLAEILASGDRSLVPLLRQAGQPEAVIAALKRPRAEAPEAPPGFHPLGGGRIGVGHRPRIRSLPAMRAAGATHVLTLLSREEGAPEVGRAVEAAGLAWIWLPLRNGDPPAASRDAEFDALFRDLRGILREGGTVFVHCSAGIHRTGMVTAGLLASMGVADLEGELRRLRAVTGDGVGAARLAWSARFGDPRG